MSSILVGTTFKPIHVAAWESLWIENLKAFFVVVTYFYGL